MTREQLLWIKLAEEANELLAELIHVSLKTAQLGTHHSQDCMPENIDRIAAEIADLEAIFTLLEVKGLIPRRTPEERQAATLAKWAKLEKWAKVSEELGFVTPDKV